MEEFNILTDVYLPLKEKKDKLNSPAYKIAKENNIDTALLDGRDLDPFSTEIIPSQEVTEDTKQFTNGFLEFLQDLPQDIILSFVEGTAYGAEFFGKLGTLAHKVAGDPLQVAENTDKIVDSISAFRDKVKNAKSGNFYSELVGMVAQDLPYSVPLYKTFTAMGMPKGRAIILSGAIGGALSFQKEDSFLMDSDLANAVKTYMNAEPGSPEEAIIDKLGQSAEYSVYGYMIPPIIKGLKKAKNFLVRPTPATATTGLAVGAASDNNEAEAAPNIIKPTGEVMLNSMLPKLSKELAPTFFSKLKQTVDNLGLQKGSSQQFLKTIENTPGVKKSEIKWTGLDSFLGENRNATKQEIAEFINANNIDVNEVKFSGKKQQFSKELQDLINDYEARWRDSTVADAAAPNYDSFKIFLGREADAISYGKMDFNTLQSVLGDDIAAESFEVLPTGLLKYKNLDPINSFTEQRVKTDNFFIHPLELERYKIEKMIRQNPNMQTGKPKFERFTEPGGTDYTELVFSIKKGGMDIGIPIDMTRSGKPLRATTPYKNPNHMNVKSEIAHVRFKTRYGEGLNDGKKILAVEEMQNDFGIRVNKSNKQKSSLDQVKDFPFKNTWYEMILKRLVRYGADNGFDAIAIPKGELAANRYGSNIDKVKTVSMQKNRFKEFPDTDEYVVRYFDEDKKDVQEKYFVKSALPLLEKEIGPKAFKKLMDAEKAQKFTAGKGEFEVPIDKPIVIGSGSGKYRLYNETIPSFMKKYGKNWNAKVYDDKFRVDDLNIDSEFASDRMVDIPVTIIELTPEMKKAAQEQGQPLFEILGPILAGGAATKEVLDNQR